jgi:hypothetical protein
MRGKMTSPDGRWLAYEANDTGAFEIYVPPFPDVTRERWQVSTSGGTQPLWAQRAGAVLFRAGRRADARRRGERPGVDAKRAHKGA